MEINYMTKKELTDKVNEKLKRVSLKDKKWLYCYFNGLDEWPIVTDEVKSRDSAPSGEEELV